MRKIGTVLVMLAILVVGVGFYRGWFALSKAAPEPGSNEVNINLATDPDKIKQDVQTAKDKAAELTGGVTEDVKVGVPANDNTTSNDP